MRNPYDYSDSSFSPYIPALAIKIFRDGIYSGNILAINALVNQNTTNFFQSNFVLEMSDGIDNPIGSNHLKIYIYC